MFSLVETRLFTRLAQQYLSDEQYAELQRSLASNPDAGAVIAGTGGVRKLRWAAPGRGKRGGYRVIYYVIRDRSTIWLLTIYPKNVTDTIPADTLRRIRKEIDDAED